MGALLRMFRRKDAETKKREQETAEKERKAGDRYGRLSKSQLKSWEGKYGNNGETTSGSSDDRTLYALELDKVRSNGSGSTFLSGKQGPVDFLPKFDFVGSPAGGGANEPLIHTPPTPPIPWTAAKRASTLSSRPVLAPLQPVATAPEWDRYLSSRTLSVAQHQAQSSRAPRTLSMYSLSDPAALAAAGRTSSAPSAMQPSLSGDAHGGRIAHEDLVVDDDDIPLAVAAAVRTRSSPILPRPSTMYDLSASPSLTQQGNNSFPTLPRSHSRAASLSMPAILAQPVTPPLPPSTSFTGTSPNLASIGKRATLIDLTEPSLVDPYQQRNGRSGPVGGEERIVTGDRSRAGKKREEKPKSEGPKILDFEELENRHKKRMSQLQTTATDHLTTEAAKKRFQQQQQREAEQQRRKEAEAARRRSVSSNLNLVAGSTSMKGGRSPTIDDFGAFKANSAADPRRRSSTSMSGLSALLKFGSSSSIPTPPPAEASSSSTFSPPLASTRARRQSTLALVQPPSTSTSSSSTPSGSSSSAPRQPIASTSRTRPPRPTLAGTRRHSLGTLLEASYEASLVAASDEYGNDDLEPPARPFAFAPHGWSRGGREPGHEKRVEKVQEWRRRSSSEQSLSSASAAAAAVRRQGSSEEGGSRNASSSSVVSEKTRAKGRGEFGLLQKEVAKGGAGAGAAVKEEGEGTKKKKKHDWLAY